jgi:cytochrome c oxidase subunit IV
VLFLLVFMLVKATMIGGNFMHLRYEQRNLAFIVAAGLLVTSAILFAFITPESLSVRARRSEPVAPAAAPAHHP